MEIIDEGKYWKTRDENLLQDIFKQNVDLLDNFSFAIESIPIKNGESYENYFERLVNRIRNRNQDKD
ncbi:MAG: hypothetical protein U9Q83_03235 [Bacteroidota bacterium]|nr:hypothetical protein [Bacteroidota bacterium]